MDPWQEPVRGATLPPSAYTLDGLERLRGYRRGLWPNTPLHHLIGVRSTQASNGAAVASLPVTGWLAHGDGSIEIGAFAMVACGLAAYTVVPPRSATVPLQSSYSPVRHVQPGTRTLLGRSQVVRSSPDWAYVAGSVEDDEGRVVAAISAHVGIEPVAFPVPDVAPQFAPYEPPRYPSPDPHQRPVPPRYAALRDSRDRRTAEAMRAAAAANGLPVSPLHELLGIRMLDAAEGVVTMELRTSPWLEAMDPGGPVPWALSALAEDACGATMWTLLRPGAVPALLQSSLTYAAATPADGRALTARARGERVGDLLLTTVDIRDGQRRVATGTTSARLVPERMPGSPTPRRVLTTVLFTDIAGSTGHAEALGDDKWGRVLAEHHGLVGSRIDDHGGRLVKTTGDGMLATFESPTQAVECARAIRDDVGRLGIEIRAGVHTGECEVVGGDISGIAVHIASRVEASAPPGEVWVSETTKALTVGSALRFSDQGHHDLKGIDEPLRLYRLDAP